VQLNVFVCDLFAVQKGMNMNFLKKCLNKTFGRYPFRKDSLLVQCGIAAMVYYVPQVERLYEPRISRFIVTLIQDLCFLLLVYKKIKRDSLKTNGELFVSNVQQAFEQFQK
jgi:hypothetical protein